MSLNRRVRDLEAKAIAGRCHVCGGPVKWLVSIEEREALRERIAGGERHCDVCAEQVIHHALAVRQALIDATTRPREKAY